MHYFYDKVLEPARVFGHTEAEWQNLLGTLAMKLVESGLQPISSELLRQEVHEQPSLYEGIMLWMRSSFLRLTEIQRLTKNQNSRVGILTRLFVSFIVKCFKLRVT